MPLGLGVSDFRKPTYLPKNRTSYVDGPLDGAKGRAQEVFYISGIRDFRPTDTAKIRKNRTVACL